MKQKIYQLDNINELKEELKKDAADLQSDEFETVFIQIFSSVNEGEWFKIISNELLKKIPTAVIVGASSVGEICNGKTIRGKTVVSITLFESSHVKVISHKCISGEERELGHLIGQQINSIEDDIAGIMLLATPLSIDTSELVKGLAKRNECLNFFGGGAGNYEAARNSLIIHDLEVIKQGALAVIFYGPKLQIKAMTYLGWKAVSKEMRITESEGMIVKTIDGKEAFMVYDKYLNIPRNEQFFLNAIGFTFLFNRGGEMVSRVPIAVDEHGALTFIADMYEGETFSLGYGDPATILKNAEEVHGKMKNFNPDSIYLYSCSSRHTLMGGAVEIETIPFQEIAPTSGFYTYGEYFGSEKNLNVLNSTMVAVGLRENAQDDTDINEGKYDSANSIIIPTFSQLDLLNHKDYTGASKLAHLIEKAKEEIVQNSSPKLFVQCLGGFTCSSDDAQNKYIRWRTSKVEELFGFLIHHEGNLVSREQIIEALWPDWEFNKAAKIFHTTSYYMRKELEIHGQKDILIKSQGKYALNMQHFNCDKLEFINLIKKMDLEKTSIETLEKASCLYKGPYFGLSCYEWASAQQTWLENKYLKLSLTLAKQYGEIGDINKSAEILNSIILENPLSDEAYKALIVLLINSGYVAEAVRCYKKYEVILSQEIGINPSVEIKSLMRPFL
ncbi:FIST N-terminal domain-containing protein [Serpentinicella alkaliphila]|uniref:Two-component SAPR family response regulator n=1 Tax=Serpentinicella alkaliphila TaxID=1734049 RepID=A0A4R2THB8_9FIRM|nr:FIST N-terminal domain-containing protein [Serpentinicella alkaliphila]QUH25476.1 FIST C-terminal domain-containing protein [Serpentinicella alkaliphila]TCQ01602.1 two-component SAPR family response regulator [Serpentinicella alkaliphila]